MNEHQSQSLGTCTLFKDSTSLYKLGMKTILLQDYISYFNRQLIIEIC